MEQDKIITGKEMEDMLKVQLFNPKLMALERYKKEMKRLKEWEKENTLWRYILNGFRFTKFYKKEEI